MPPTLESRMVGFFVKDSKKEEFKERFNNRFREEYILYSREEILKSNLLGYGEKHRKVKEFLGDYIAIAISDMRIKIGTYLSREMKKPDEKKSTHCGLTRNEMEVPLIIFAVSGGARMQEGIIKWHQLKTKHTDITEFELAQKM